MPRSYFLVVALCLAFLLTAPVHGDSTIQQTKIDLANGASVPASVNVSAFFNISAPDTIAHVVYATFSETGFFQQNTTITLWINGKYCANGNFVIPVNASFGQYSERWDCSNIITQQGVYNFTAYFSKPVSALGAWLDIGYINNPLATVNLHGTEYLAGEPAKIWLQLLDSNQSTINNATCFVDIYYPDGRQLLEKGRMTFTEDGIYQYNLIAPSLVGVYPAIAVCYYQTGSLTFTASNGTILNGTNTANDYTATNILDGVYWKTTTVAGGAGHILALNFTFINLTQPVGMNSLVVDWTGKWNGASGDLVTFWIYNYTSASYMALPNTLSGNGATAFEVSNTLSLTNISNSSFVRNGTVKIIMNETFTGGNKQLQTDFLSVQTIGLINPTWQVTRGSSEMHVQPVSANLYAQVDTLCGNDFNSDGYATSNCAYYNSSVLYPEGVLIDNITVTPLTVQAFDTHFHYITPDGEDCNGVNSVKQSPDGQTNWTDVTNATTQSLDTLQNCNLQIPYSFSGGALIPQYFKITMDNYLVWEMNWTEVYANVINATISPFCYQFAQASGYNYTVPITPATFVPNDNSPVEYCERAFDDYYYLRFYAQQGLAEATAGKAESDLAEVQFYRTAIYNHVNALTNFLVIQNANITNSTTLPTILSTLSLVQNLNLTANQIKILAVQTNVTTLQNQAYLQNINVTITQNNAYLASLNVSVAQILSLSQQVNLTTSQTLALAQALNLSANQILALTQALNVSSNQQTVFLTTINSTTTTTLGLAQQINSTTVQNNIFLQAINSTVTSISNYLNGFVTSILTSINQTVTAINGKDFAPNITVNLTEVDNITNVTVIVNTTNTTVVVNVTNTTVVENITNTTVIVNTTQVNLNNVTVVENITNTTVVVNTTVVNLNNVTVVENITNTTVVVNTTQVNLNNITVIENLTNTTVVINTTNVTFAPVFNVTNTTVVVNTTQVNLVNTTVVENITNTTVVVNTTVVNLNNVTVVENITNTTVIVNTTQVTLNNITVVENITNTTVVVNTTNVTFSPQFNFTFNQTVTANVTVNVTTNVTVDTTGLNATLQEILGLSQQTNATTLANNELLLSINGTVTLNRADLQTLLGLAYETNATTHEINITTHDLYTLLLSVNATLGNIQINFTPVLDALQEVNGTTLQNQIYLQNINQSLGNFSAILNYLNDVNGTVHLNQQSLGQILGLASDTNATVYLNRATLLELVSYSQEINATTLTNLGLLQELNSTIHTNTGYLTQINATTLGTLALAQEINSTTHALYDLSLTINSTATAVLNYLNGFVTDSLNNIYALLGQVNTTVTDINAKNFTPTLLVNFTENETVNVTNVTFAPVFNFTNVTYVANITVNNSVVFGGNITVNATAEINETQLINDLLDAQITQTIL